ncbi:PorT family protein [Flavobacterium sp. MFBS3-15]|uniref:porin family protein n=1 Tax=Flavobacterium sp. MFBS3-15 TaxID=2989816 RepID=UPI0022356557|nr:porin family protein [Flavobacterium sp. MFBS3-15]MCW4467441.1 PorT family protein [Flavobacterium sp. MFBS3-15]
MKKLLLSAVAVMAFGFTAQAQMDEFPIFGIKGGVNLSNFGADAEDTDMATSFYAGVSLDIPMKGIFHLQAEALYSVEGADEASITYLRMPVMGKFYVGNNFNVQVGPVLGAKLDTEDKYLNKATKALDYGAAAGLSYEFNMGLVVDARYYLGLADINRSESTDKITNNSIQLGLGFRF